MNTIVRILILSLSFVACQEARHADIEQVSNMGPAQGSTYKVSYIVSPGIDYRNSIDSILLVMDEEMSLWHKNSAISKINNGDTVSLGHHFIEVLNMSQKMCKATGGNFDITVASLTDLMGFGPNERGTIDSSRVDSLMRFVGPKFLDSVLINKALPKGVRIDMNAIAQGYTVDVIAEFLQQKGIKNYMVEVGGEVRCLGENINGNVWRIGIDKPSSEAQNEHVLQTIVKLDSASLATSGNYRKFWIDENTGIKYSHTINPKTGFPAKNRLLSATIVAPTCMEADAWATTCMVVGLEKAKEYITQNSKLEAYFIYSGLRGEFEFWRSPGFEKIEP